MLHPVDKSAGMIIYSVEIINPNFNTTLLLCNITHEQLLLIYDKEMKLKSRNISFIVIPT